MITKEDFYLLFHLANLHKTAVLIIGPHISWDSKTGDLPVSEVKPGCWRERDTLA